MPPEGSLFFLGGTSLSPLSSRLGFWYNLFLFLDLRLLVSVSSTEAASSARSAELSREMDDAVDLNSLDSLALG